jgi:hypothetical protein
MAKRSRDKGNSFERKVAKLIIAAAGKGFSNKDCYRTPLSGGHPYAGSSDLVMRSRLRKLLPFCVECKHYKTWRLEHMFRLTSVVKAWHKQVRIACKKDRYNRSPVLVIRGFGGLIFASAPLECWVTWMQDGKGVLPVTRLDYTYKGKLWCVFAFEDVLSTIKRKAEKARCST